MVESTYAYSLIQVRALNERCSQCSEMEPILLYENEVYSDNKVVDKKLVFGCANLEKCKRLEKYLLEDITKNV